MALMIATATGTRLALDVAVDSNCDRLVAMALVGGVATSWVSSAGVVTRVDDGADGWDVVATVPGPYSGAVSLALAGGEVLATSTVVSVGSGERVEVRFRFARARDKELALAGAAPTVSTLKLGSCFLVGVATTTAPGTGLLFAASALSATATQAAAAVATWSGAAALAADATQSATPGLTLQAASALAADATQTAAAVQDLDATSDLAADAMQAAGAIVSLVGAAALAADATTSATPTVVLGLAAIPNPQIYYTFDGTYANVMGGNDASPQNAPTFVTGSLPGKQAVNFAAADHSYVQIGGGINPLTGTGDSTLVAHVKMTDDFAWLLSSMKSDGSGQGVEMSIYDLASGAGGPVILHMNQVGGGYTIDERVGYVTELTPSPDWHSLVISLDRNGLARVAVDGVFGPVTFNISAADGIDMFSAVTFSILGIIGSRIAGSAIYKSLVVAEWAWFLTAFDDGQATTIETLRQNGTSIKDHLGL